jgi:hypothetical protein
VQAERGDHTRAAALYREGALLAAHAGAADLVEDLEGRARELASGSKNRRGESARNAAS